MDEWIGLHERLWTPALARWIAALGLTDQQLRTAAELPSEQAVPMLAAHLARVWQQRLALAALGQNPGCRVSCSKYSTKPQHNTATFDVASFRIYGSGTDGHFVSRSRDPRSE